MKTIQTKLEYEKKIARIDELLTFVGNNTCTSTKHSIELDSISDQVADYEEKFDSITRLSLIGRLKTLFSKVVCSSTRN